MNRLCFVLVLLSVVLYCGCVSQSDYDALAADFRAMNDRISKIEGDLYKVEEKSAPKQEKKTEQKFVPAKEVEQSVIDIKINAFLSEYLGVAFGDSIDKYPNPIEGRDYLYDYYRTITVRKKFQYFDKALAHFEEGKLYAVSFFADIEDKYSIDSTNERISKTRADLAATFGLASDAFKNNSLPNFFPSGKRAFPLSVRRDKNSHSTSYELEKLKGGIIGIVPEGFRRYGVMISDDNLCIRLRDEKAAKDRAKGEQLPEAK